jgi:diguanylate cyclase (GGDEF)-like protein/PAS domain S-box-containing protein
MPSNFIRPKILGFISEQASPWVVAITALVLGAALTIILALANFELYQRQLTQRFGLLANEHFSRIQERLDGQVYRLESLRRFFVFSDQVSRAEFDGFAAPLLIGTQAYSWAPRVVDTAREGFERQAVIDGLSGFTVRELDMAGRLRQSPVRAEYFPVLFTQSRSNLPLPLGFDIASEQVRHEALERARQLGAMVATPRVRLVGMANATGILLLAPVLVGDARFSTGPDDVTGFVLAAISFDALMTEGLPTQENLCVTLRDLASFDQQDVLFQSSTLPAQSNLRVSTLLRMADRNYLLEIRPTLAFLNANQSQRSSVILLGGLLSVMLSTLLYSLVGQRQRALRLVDQRTAELRQREQQLRGTHGQLRNVLNAATEVAIIATDLNGVISTFNVGAQKMLGYGHDEVVGRFRLKDLQLTSELQEHAQRLSLGYGTQVSAAEAIFVEASQESIHQSREWTFVRHDGSTLSVNMLVTAVRDEQDRWVGYLAICIDITERKRIHEALAARDCLFEKLSAHVPGGIYQQQMDIQGRSRFTYISRGMCELYELTPEHMQKEVDAVFSRIHPLDAQRIRESVYQSAEHLKPWREEYRINAPRQGLRWLRVEATPERLADGEVLWHGFVSDITQMKRVEEDLRTLSVTDALTGAFNRRYFQERFSVELARVHRQGAKLSVIMLDIDNFKRINDQLGHAKGDWALQAVSQRISLRLRRNDVFCRLGGEEFMVLCPDTNAQQAYQLAVELWQGLRSRAVDGIGIVTASFGVAGWREGEGEDALLLRVDSLVYAAKQAGRDRVEPDPS